ncbi:putative DNA-binding domain-containing protein [Ferrimonas pelagia]|uniref:Putative DNA-binding domain-containing protein n=1 Tax=Ferrimonas pelagia TaxID=1177826 RepID=A0ABP9EBG6_9GAMM
MNPDPLRHFRQFGAQGFAPSADPAALATALSIYHNNRLGIRRRAVSLSYPLTEQLLGKPLFRPMLKAFCHQASMPHALEHSGAGLLHWLRAQPQGPALFADYPFLPSLLRWEWAHHLAYHSERYDPASHERCDLWLRHPSEPPPWRLHPALSVLSSRYPLAAIVARLTALSQGRATEGLAIERGDRRCWAVWPTLDNTAVAQLTPAQRRLLRWLKPPQPASLTPELFSPLPQLLKRGWLVARNDSAPVLRDLHSSLFFS